MSASGAGAAFHARASRILSDLEEAEASASALRRRGTVRISAPVAFGRRHLGAVIDDILKAFPELAIDLSLSDRFVDLVDEGFDLAVRTGALPDSRLVVRRLSANRRILVASPDYLRRRGRPGRPETWSAMTA
jgi:DNA-binding transcriptional LysR family regulator